LSSEEDKKEREENSHVLESHQGSLLRNVMIIDDELDALLFEGILGKQVKLRRGRGI